MTYAVDILQAEAIVVDTPYGKLQLPALMYQLWEEHGWPEDQVLAEMAADGRWAPS